MPPRNKRRGARSTLAPTQRPQDQYHHIIPRFILRRFHVGPRNDEKITIRSGVDPGQVLYYDLASGILDVRSIGTVYGQKNFYRDASNPSNVNEVEEKLSLLEGKAALTIEILHSELARGKVTIKRRHLDILRKFMFVMHYRKMGSTYFDPNLQPSLRQWLIRYQTEHQCQTHVDVWLRIMRYYLDTPHSQIVDDAHAEYKKYGYAEAFEQVATGVDPIMEHPESIAYQVQAERYFLGIWEAEATSEFIMTTSAFGLWEGLTPELDTIHRIFVISPHVALVLRSNVLPLPGEPQAPMQSVLLSIPQEKPKSRLVNGETAIRLSDMNDMSEFNRHRSPNDDFTFTITKLTLDQTDAFNTIILQNARSDGAVTFLGRERMLRTLRVFWNSPLYKFLRHKYASLMRYLSIIPQPLSHASISSSFEPVDAELYVALMGIVLNRTKFASGYDRALSIYRLLQTTSRRRTCPFVTQHIYNLSLIMESCVNHFPGPSFRKPQSSLRLKMSLPSELSLRIFTTLENFVSITLGAKMDFDEDVLGKLGKEVALLGFLDWLDVEMPMVLINGMSVMDILTVMDAFYFV
ncbi:uncharacterized protein EV420DRAFT_1563698 [Desarmillaria tabescens]|uniref:DUF4238 domain-containing protein n=1 Tax=Armillaria tabescens TaxID=1929756 RepID=A0AA39JVJ7_ARMTA|nr:uncharacterized protein EV420DRAFT_1563698 [Desarmillaria tabescens]KAK0449722.1 hypothetical protein EV420DRAFT_1563698 [Desarmillaria tabescens]